MKKNPSDLAFLLQESGTNMVDAVDVLHTADPMLANRTPFLPKGLTEADAWIARNGDPTFSTDAALRLARMVGKVHRIDMVSTDPTRGLFDVELCYERLGGSPVKTRTFSLPVAICAAVMKELDLRGQK